MKEFPPVMRSEEKSAYCPVCTLAISPTLAVCPECSNTKPSAGWPDVSTSPYPWLGKILDGRYILNQFLGDGATGYVYRAQALQIHRLFAAKIVDTRRYGKAEFEAELMRRFHMEVEAMSRLRNPHVVNIYEAMQLHDSVFVVIMDFVDGRTLQELLDRVGRIKLHRALDIVRQTANGLYEAHALGFIHRDLKPDNIMIERLPASGFFAKILDFGIVHMMDDVGTTQGFRGTPLYASPEQCLGDPKIDHRSDIYSLGCVFFHLISGQPPFPGTESLLVMDHHVNDPPPLVRDVIPHSHIPQGVEDLLQRMLAKNPKDRPANMSEVIRAIDRLLYETQLEEHTNTNAPPSEAFATSVGAEMRTRLETADFPMPNLGEASSAVSRIVRPMIDFQLPAEVAKSIKGITASALHRQGGHAAIADQASRIHVMSLKNDGYFLTLEGALSIVTALHLDSTSAWVYSGELDGSVRRWDISKAEGGGSGGKAERLFQLTDRIFAVSSDTRTKRVVVGTEKGRIVAYDQAKNTTQVLIPAGRGVSALAMSPTENKVFVGYWGGDLEVIDLHSKKVTKLDSVPSNPISTVISDDGYIAAVLDDKGTIRILSLVHGSSFFEITADVAHLKSLAFDQNSQLLGMGVEKTAVHLWDIRSQQAVNHL